MNDEALAIGGAWGRTADVLTVARALSALPLALSAWAGNWTLATLLLGAAWWSDFFDGRLARRAGGSTRLGRWDLPADTVVGAGLLAGLVAGSHLSPVLGVLGAALGVGYVVLGNASLSMLLQALAYGPVLWFAATGRSFGFAVAVLTIVAIGVWDRDRLVGWVLPTFFAGILGKRGKRGTEVREWK